MTAPGTAAEEKPDRRSRILLLVVLALVSLAACLCGLLFYRWSVRASQAERLIPVSVHSGSRADYSADSGIWLVGPVGMELLIDALRDREPFATDLPQRLTEIAVSFQTPVRPPSTSTPISSSTSTAVVTSTPGPSSTPSSSPTLSLSTTVSSTASAALTPTPSRTPTSALLPSSTPTAPPSPTLAPPTAPLDPCAGLSLSGFNRSGDKVSWTLSNGSSSSVTITAIDLNWPSSNDKLKRIELSGKTIWNKGDDSPPTNITSGWKGGASRTISGGQSKPLEFEFDESAASSGYSLDVTLDNGCVLSP